MKPVALIFAVCLVAACAQHGRSRHLVYIVDVTGSVTADARAGAIAGLQQVFRILKRGDTVSVIPITDDSAVDAPTQTLRFALSTKREPYDADLRRVAHDADAQLASLLALAKTHPYGQTDLLGTFQLASEEFGEQAKIGDHALVCLSDFIQDDRQYDFKHDPRLTTPAKAKQLAGQLVQRGDKPLRGVHVYLGLLPSSDLRTLSQTRRDAIHVFWVEWLCAQGATVRWATDGAGQVLTFLESPADAVLAESTQE